MSGPITCGYFIAQGVLMLAARALEEARAMKREYGDVLAQLRDRERSLISARQGQRAARLERIAVVRGDAARLASRLARLSSLAESMSAHAAVAVPAAPATADDAAWSNHVRDLEAAVRTLEAALANAGAGFGDRLRDTLTATGAAPSIDDVLSAYVLQRQMQPGLDAAQTERFRQTAARILARLELPAGLPLPAALEALAKQIVLAPSIERAEALATELRLAVQREGDAQGAAARDKAEAVRLLDELPEDAPAPLLHALEHVVAGASRLDATLRQSATAVVNEAAADREQREQSAAAIVLQESLRDLGYEVEDIEATLFADGGVAHFRRDGWDNYFVRMRVDPLAHSVNFNVVRARGDEESAERRRQDTLAEDRWCTEFPKLLQTLEARGLTLQVTRRLDAGEVPVQVVEPASVPRVAPQEEDVRPGAAPRATKLP